MFISLSQLATILNGTLIGKNADFHRVSLDTRTLWPGDLYIAILGDRFDGHDFVSDAERCGAVAAVTHCPVETLIPQVCVSDTRQALFDLAHFYRQQMKMPVVAVTGSCGKTTTRALIESILKSCGPILATQKSFNNFIGVPLTLMQWSAEHRYAVIEMGANHPGEIAKLTHLVQPTVAVITNAGPAHLEGFGDLQGVASAKGEIFQGLSSDGVAIISADDVFSDFWRKLVDHRRVMTFGISQSADVMAKNIEVDKRACSRFTLQTPVGNIDIELPLMGIHNVKNALAAAAVALACNISLPIIQQGLSDVHPVGGRLIEKRGFAGATIIDDSYNANPASVAAAIQVLAKRSGDSVLVLGDMLELGDASTELHRQLGELARQSGLHRLYCYGEKTVYTARAFGENALHFEDKTRLVHALKETLSDQVTVLVKGSYSMQMGTVVNALLE